MTRSVVAGSPVVALWRTMIGKKVVMAITGAVLVGFVTVHMVGNLKIFGPEEINAYSRFLREVGSAWAELRTTTVACPDSPAGMRRASHHRRHPTHSHELGRATPTDTPLNETSRRHSLRG